MREQLLRGTYKPQPVRRVEIQKPGGGVRKLSIPTVLDRLIQQAVLQVLQKRWDPTFSKHSFGFRPRRSAHQAVAQAQAYIVEGYQAISSAAESARMLTRRTLRFEMVEYLLVILCLPRLLIYPPGNCPRSSCPNFSASSVCPLLPRRIDRSIRSTLRPRSAKPKARAAA